MHFQLIFVCGVRGSCDFILLYIVVLFFPHNLLKRLSFLHCILPSFVIDKLTVGVWVYFTALSFMFHWSINLSLSEYHTTVSEQAMAPHSSTLAWKIPWMEEPGGLQSMGSLRVGHDWVTSLSVFTCMHWRRQWHPTPVLLLGESHGRRSLVGCSP